MARKKVARTLIWSEPAQINIDDIVDYYNRRNGSPTYSNRLTLEFRERMNMVVANPYSGQRWMDDFRYVIVKPFQLFYYVTKTEVIVAAVWDARRDPDTLKLTR